MRLAVASDIHTEYHRDRGRDFFAKMPDADAVVLAGDVGDSGSIYQALRFALDRYRDVVFVFGNHEFWGATFDEVRNRIDALCGASDGRLHVLDRGTCRLGAVRIVGATLWMRHAPGMKALEPKMPDFWRIQERRESIYYENRLDETFLRDTVRRGDVVVTHHAPSLRSIHPTMTASVLNPFFVCELDDLVVDRRPSIWLHGHMHTSAAYRLGDTRVICNPFGRPDVPNLDFDDALVLEI